VIYRFGAYVLDGETRQLLANGTEVHVSPKAFELLTFLLANRRRAVSKTELQEFLWPSTFVDEANLPSLIAEIRRALGETASEPAFVKTVHRFGYRFVGQATEDVAPATTIPTRRRPCLVFENRLIALMDGANVIGRESDATILCDAPGVSRYHARILVASGVVTVEDLGSKNGTFVKGERITSTRLSHGDEIRLGTASLTFLVTPPAGSTDTV
jgi:DNA-binding winged helix-turn-helix (wHTH) protein